MSVSLPTTPRTRPEEALARDGRKRRDEAGRLQVRQCFDLFGRESAACVQRRHFFFLPDPVTRISFATCATAGERPAARAGRSQMNARASRPRRR